MTDIKEANAKGKLEWKNGPVYSKMFETEQLDVVTMHSALVRMHTDKELFRKYFEEVRTFGPMSKSCTTDKCRDEVLCAMNTTINQRVEACFHRC